jgi:dolichyldiphosphatase
VIVYATLAWSTREAEVLLLFVGQLACEAANFALKRLIREERPRHKIADFNRTKKGYGMPSSHAQFAAFWAVSLTLFLLFRHRPTVAGSGAAAPLGARGRGTTDKVKGTWEAYAHRPWAVAERALLSAAGVLLAAAVAWSRIYLGYHTAKQVLAGAVAGTVCAVAWFGTTAVVRRAGLLDWALGSAPLRLWRIRDLVVEEDLAQAGWEKWEERRRRTREGVLLGEEKKSE